MGLGQACDSKLLNDCKRQGADQPSTRAGWPVPLLVVMGATLGTGTFKPEKNLVFFKIKSPGPHRCHPGKLE